jgi:hypothetical protein
MLTLSQEILINNLTKELKRFNDSNGKTIVQRAKWGSYEDACKIINRSKKWYQEKRATLLLEGKDWRRIGKMIEYNLESIENLRNA